MLTNATLPYVIELAEKGVERALAESHAPCMGVTVRGGEMVHPAVAQALARPASPDGAPGLT